MSTSGFYEYKWQNTPMLTQQKMAKHSMHHNISLPINVDQYFVVTQQNKPIHE
jgi:hypothetical protein